MSDTETDLRREISSLRQTVEEYEKVFGLVRQLTCDSFLWQNIEHAMNNAKARLRKPKKT